MAEERAVRKPLKLTLIFVFFLTVVAVAIDVYIAIKILEPNEFQIRLLETSETIWKMGFGGLVGLLGGNRLS